MHLPTDSAKEGTASFSTQSLASAPQSYHSALGVINLSDDMPLKWLSNLPSERPFKPSLGDQKWKEGSFTSTSLACELQGEGHEIPDTPSGKASLQ